MHHPQPQVATPILNTASHINKTCAGFSLRAQTTVIKFCCKSLSELNVMSVGYLDMGIVNLHKAISSLNAINHVRLNVSKCMNLHSICQHFLDRVKWHAPLDGTDILALRLVGINATKAEFVESTQLIVPTIGLGDVKIPKITHLKWPKFKSALTKLLGQVVGQNKIPLLYVIRENNAGDFEDTYDNRRTKLVAYISHTGSAFKAGNGNAYLCLLQHTENTKGYAIIQTNEQCRKGQKTRKELLSYFKRATYKQKYAHEASTILKTDSYSGPKKNFSFDDYYKLHSSVHSELLRALKPMSIEKKLIRSSKA